MPTIGRVLETSLYVDQLDRAADFYERIFGFERIQCDDRFCAFNVSGEQVLLLFVIGKSTTPVAIPGGIIPPHDGQGQSHLAFTIASADEQAWTRRLNAAGIAIESRVTWPRGGFSLYFRDPDRNLLELVSPGCWKIY
jgi:catechol 2,3-dioxygenase-like lactoylglutathione lyase family enzyme